MIIQCSNCQTRYHYDDARFAGAAVKKIRCTKCATIFEIRNPAVPVIPPGFQADETGPLGSPIMGSDDFALDTTVMGGGPRKRVGSAPPPLPNSPIGRAIASSVPAASRPAAPVPPPLPRESQHPATQSTDEFPRGAAGVSAADANRLKLPIGYRLSLACLAGPDSGRIFEVDRPRMTIGRASADIVLSDAQCSRQHAAIEVMEDQVFVMDLGSTNGTFYGDKRISRVELENRSEFDVGATTLMFIRTRQE